MRKPSILMVCHVIPPAYGGAGSQAMALAVALVARGGCSVHLVGAISSRAKRRETIQGVIVRRLGNPWPGRLGRYTFYLSLLVYVLLRRHKYDLIHVHGVFWHATICALVAKLTGTPLIVKMTRMGDDDVTTIENLRRGSIKGALRVLPLLIAGRLIALNSKMLGDSKLSRPELRCELLPNGVDTDFWRPPKTDERKSARAKYTLSGLVVLFTGGFLKHKGLSFLLQALSQSRRNVTLFVVGPHDSSNNEVESGLATELDTWATSKKNLCRVIWLGLVNRDQMRELYWASDVYVHPSQREGNPNSLVEAMACQCRMYRNKDSRYHRHRVTRKLLFGRGVR